MPDADRNPSLKPGTPTRIGSYRLIEPLGSGGMSSVFRAAHDESGHEVALKILPRSLAKNPTMLQRFLREAKSAEALLDPHVVEIFDRGAEDGRYYLVLEYVDGGDLHDRIRKHGPMPLHEAVDAVRSAALGLRHAEQKGLIHRDIKPANLLRTSEGRVKLTDLGLALQMADEDERVTRDGTTVGTVDYMAPEQARDSRATSARSDMYSLGCTFYYLLTGKPPFPGGDVPEKLRRHAHEPAPDVRDLRPDAPEELADLVKRMMAKKPEHRFVDYDHLIDAINELPIASPGGPLTALIDEDDDEPPVATALIDDEDDRDQPVLTALIDDEDDQDKPEPGPALTALIDEDDDDDSAGYTLGPPTSGTEPGSTGSSPTIPASAWSSPKARSKTEPALGGVDFSKLSELESEDAAEPVQRPRPRRPEPVSTLGSPPVSVPGKAVPRLDEVDEAEADAGPVVQPRPRPQIGPPPGPSPVVVLLRVALGILIVIFAGIGLSNLLSLMTSRQPPSEITDSDANTGTPQPASRPVLARGHAAGPRWVEPAEPKQQVPPEPAFSEPEIEAVGLASAEPEGASQALAPVVIVQRAPSLVDRDHAESLRRALDALSGTVEIDDDGPFHENDLRVHGKHRLIRAGKGRRPVVVARPRLRSVRDRPALVVLDGATLTIEGIDLVVKAADLNLNQTALFRLKGSHLTLRDCTITVEGPGQVPLAVVQAGESGEPGPYQPSSVRLERTLIRGPRLSAVRIAEGPCDVVVSRSALLSGDAPVFSASGGGDNARSLGLLGSVLSSADGILELRGSAAGPRATPFPIHALGTTFARAEGAGLGGLVVIRDPAANGPQGSGVAWTGDRNQFEGWNAPPSASKALENPGLVSLQDLNALRAVWPDSDADSESQASPWPTETQSGWVGPRELASRFPALKGQLAHVASPSPNLRAWSVGTFEPLPAEPPEPAPAFSKNETTQMLTLDASREVGTADLGAFLAKQVRPNVDRVQVRVVGHGWHPCSPVELPEGVSLEILVDSSPSDPLIWRPVEGASGEALINIRNADLSVFNAVFERDARANLAHVVRVDQGRLVMSGCRLLAPGQVETGGGNLVAFRTDGTRPLVAGASGGRDWPVCALTDCVLITGGDAIKLELGRGLASLTNCALASGSDAITLSPEAVARDRFAAELRLDHCTLASEVNFVHLEPWTGSPSGPNRPWLVSSRFCAFLDRYDRGRSPSSVTLLRADPSALDTGSIVWQSDQDAYDITHYVVRGADSPSPVSFPDVRRQWQDFWGDDHVVMPRGEGQAPRFVVDRLKPGAVKPGDLVLEPVGRIDNRPPVGANLSKLGISPSAGGAKR